MPFTKLTEKQLDSLREIGNVGMSHAATALSQLIGQRVDLRSPRVAVSTLAEISEILGGAGRVVAGITLQVLGDARGSMLLIFPGESMHRLLSSLLGKEEKGMVLNELGASTLKEVGNILASAYLSALGSLLGMTLIPSVPLLTLDTAGAVTEYIGIQLQPKGNAALLVETEFLGSEGRERICGHFFLLPAPCSLQKFFQSLDGRKSCGS